MGLFKKKDEVDFDRTSGMILSFGLILPDRAMLVKHDLPIDSKHIMAVNTGYIIGISMFFIIPQIGLNKVNEFIRSSMNIAYKVLLPERFSVIPNMQKYAEKATRFLITKLFSGDIFVIFDELTERYLADLYEDRQYSEEIFTIARNDLMFYYQQMDEVIKRIKIV